MLPRQQRRVYRRCLGNANRSRCRRRRAHRQLYQEHGFSALIRTRRMLTAVTPKIGRSRYSGLRPLPKSPPDRRSSWPVWNRTRSRSPSLVTSVEFPITPIRITVAVAQSGWHLSAVPAPLLAVSGPTGWCAAAVPAFPSPGTAELVRRACAVEVMRAGNVCIRCSGRAVTWLAQPTGTRSAHLPSTPSVAARESRRGDRDR